MIRRVTSSIQIDDRLVLRPASSIHVSQIIEAFEETWPDVIRAMPWINPDKEINSQIEDFIQETEKKGRVGLLHHWVMVRPWDEFILGLIGFDRVTRSRRAVWNLGYWVRSSEQQFGIARKSIDAVLRWLGQIDDLTVELKVDPKNEPGRKTVMRAVRNWDGERCIEGDSPITVAGVRTLHECHIIEVGPGKRP
ncbi:MAG: GNAT family N-acetyltransferase [Candidatus Thalassarchaeaceae archaeon]|jgi:RimJ/RimL family protein N-acetyltransferase|nr:GNAT family N-acetyltransferase [Candidatus Thalassarchaeaceae archaeon]MDP6703320.1 GNAT family N-acetyltransferase [Candidatus Thalassarchaeaceae archaeon]MDP7004091.1 GNAT family N-acetyltransferase [Candidatus Thalassarchaeaceae archaeon]